MHSAIRIGLVLASCAAAASLRAATLDLAALPHATRGEVIETPGIVYASQPGYRALELTLYQPVRGNGALPIVLALHGGGWFVNPDKPVAGSPPRPELPAAGVPSTLIGLARRGYVVANVTYRLSGEAHFPAQIQDVKQAVRFLRAHAADLGADPKHVLVWGASAGAYLAVLLGASCGVAALEPPTPSAASGPGGAPATDPGVSDCVDAVADWYGPVDFRRLDAETAGNHLPPGPMGGTPHSAPNSAESQLLGCALSTCPADLLAKANPLTYLSAQAPPFLIMHGMGDTAVPYQQSADLAEALKAAGIRATLTLVPKAEHMFAGIPASSVDRLVDQTFAFFDQVSGK